MRILVTEKIPGKGIELLSARHSVTVGQRGEFDHEARLVDVIPSYDALLSLLSNPVTEKVLEAGKKLRIVSNYAVGFNNIDVEAAKKRGVLVSNTPDVLTEATADCAFVLLLNAARHTRAAEDNLRSGNFEGWDPFGFLGHELYGKKTGIVGMGRIGRAFARRALGFGMNILYHDVRRLKPETEKKFQATWVESMDKLVKECDFLSLHCPLTPETRHLINKKRLGMMKSSAILINTSRGPVVDEAALAAALLENRIAGAGLDVFEEEPVVHPDLLIAPNCVLLPHIASATHETRGKMSVLAASSILSHLDGKPADSIPNLVYQPD